MRAKALFSLLFILAVGCGDDEGGSDGGAGTGAGAGAGGSGATGGSGGRPMLPGVDGGAGRDAGPGETEEGGPCLTAEECQVVDGEQLACVDVGFNFGVCARSCLSNADCGAELCVSFTGMSADAHCINLVNEEYAYCGIAETSDCLDTADLTCLYLPDLPIGVCTKLCASGGDDGGVPDPICSDEQFCRGGIVNSNGGPIDGVCGTAAARGETCGILEGAFCDEEDVCSPDVPADEESPFSCHQSCSETGTVCETGTCMQYQGVFYCL
jgi:hypothetical protein